MQYVHQSLSTIKKQKRISFIVVMCYGLFISLFCALCVHYFTRVFNQAFDDSPTVAPTPSPRLDTARLEEIEHILLRTTPPVPPGAATSAPTSTSTSTQTSTPAL